MANFINLQNKNLLLELLIDKKINKQEDINNIKNLLNTTINEIVNKYSINISNNLTYETILNLNRETLILFNKKKSMYNLNETNDEQIFKNNPNTIPINIKDREKQKQIQFENNLLKKQKDFESYKPIPPKNISFKDENIDTHIGNEMDNLIAREIEKREKQMKQIFTNPQSITIPNSINVSNSNNNSNQLNSSFISDNILNSMNIKKLNIGQEMNVLDNIIELDQFENNIKIDIKDIKDEERSDLNFLFNSLKTKNDINNIEIQNLNITEKIENIDKEKEDKYLKYLSSNLIDQKIYKLENILNMFDDKIEKIKNILDKLERIENNN